MNTGRKRASRYVALSQVPVILITIAIIMPAKSLGQPAGQTSTNLTEQSALPWPVKYHEVELINDYKIPSETEIAGAKKKNMESSQFKDKEKILGKEKAEKELDQKLKADLDYMIEENKKGSTKIQVMEIGDHSSWYSNWSFNLNSYDRCTTQIADPMNIFFFDKGSWNDAAIHLYNHGWSITGLANTQCAWTSNHAPSYSEAVSNLKPQRIQMGNSTAVIRDHVRIWEAPYVNGEGWWSVASAHREYLDPYYFDHCLYPARSWPPNNHQPGDSFDVAEEAVAQSLLYFQPGFWYFNDGQNGGYYPSCNHWAYNDGVTLAIDIWWKY